jgi:hypothetical protein
LARSDRISADPYPYRVALGLVFIFIIMSIVGLTIGGLVVIWLLGNDFRKSKK